MRRGGASGELPAMIAIVVLLLAFPFAVLAHVLAVRPRWHGVP